MSNFIGIYNYILMKVIKFIDSRKEYIPFSGIFLWYLRRSWYFKFIVGTVMGLFSFKLFYAVGFIMLQSKAKNEVLSIITAYHNPIEFSNELVIKYSFVFCFLVCCAIAPLIFTYAIYWKFEKGNKSNLENKQCIRVIKKIIVIFSYILLFGCSIWIVLKASPLIIYIMVFKSKNSSLLEHIFRYLFGEISSIPEVIELNYSTFAA